MATTNARRRGHGEDAIYFDATKNRLYRSKTSPLWLTSGFIE
jgi:hypothetical protein